MGNGNLYMHHHRIVGGKKTVTAAYSTFLIRGLFFCFRTGGIEEERREEKREEKRRRELGKRVEETYILILINI